MAKPSGKASRHMPLEDLNSGDHMKQEEFHLCYQAMEEGYRAELIAGVVYEPSPLGLDHGSCHATLASIFVAYAARTPGLQTADAATVILGAEDEVQPDLILRIKPSHGGQSTDTKAKGSNRRRRAIYCKGAPELVAEIAHSSRAIDLHLKKERYALAGVPEYIVVCLNPRRVFWFCLKSKQELVSGSDGIFRSKVFPGLWIHGDGLIALDYDLVMDTLNDGLQATEHKEFAAKL